MASSELGDPTPLDNLESLDKSTISVDNLQSLSITPQSNDISKSCRKIRRLQFVLHDTHMARIIDLLRVDLGAIDKTAKLKKGRARVDRQWISKFITVDWSQAFTEEGHLRLTCFFDMLPKLVSGPDAHSSLCQSYRRVQTAALGLADYNMRHKGKEYYLVKPINALPALKKNGGYVSHANFLAKRKDDPESPVFCCCFI